VRIKWLDANKTDGRLVEDDDDVVPPGGAVRVPTFLTDSRIHLRDTVKAEDADFAFHRPGYRIGSPIRRRAMP
jgi:hypothetical protein